MVVPPKLVVLVLALSPVAALAQSPPPSGRHGDGHAENHDWYKELRQPDTGSRCCNGSADGKQGDCRPAQSYLGEDGLYRAWDGREWLVVPEEQDHLDADARPQAAPLRNLWPGLLLHHRRADELAVAASCRFVASSEPAQRLSSTLACGHVQPLALSKARMARRTS